MTEVIEEFFVPIKKVKRGEVAITGPVSVDPPNPKKKATVAVAPQNVKVHSWMQKNAPRKGR
jgi:hypothetical protein